MHACPQLKAELSKDGKWGHLEGPCFCGASTGADHRTRHVRGIQSFTKATKSTLEQWHSALRWHSRCIRSGTVAGIAWHAAHKMTRCSRPQHGGWVGVLWTTAAHPTHDNDNVVGASADPKIGPRPVGDDSSAPPHGILP